MDIRYFDAEFDDDEDQYYYDCPFCMEKVYIEGGDCPGGCVHVIFCYETVNWATLEIHSDLLDAMKASLKNDIGKYIESYSDYEDEDEVDIQDIITFEDFINIVENTCFKNIIPSLSVAQIVNPFIGGTYFALVSDDDLISLSKATK